jgi:hypothetical protein
MILLQGVPNGDFELSAARRVLPSWLNAHCPRLDDCRCLRSTGSCQVADSRENEDLLYARVGLLSVFLATRPKVIKLWLLTGRFNDQTHINQAADYPTTKIRPYSGLIQAKHRSSIQGHTRRTGDDSL